jgi:hypothetical protein
LFRETVAQKSDDEITAIADKYGVLIVGPPLLEGLNAIVTPRT